MSKPKHVMGKDLMLFITGKVIALSTSCKLTIKADMQDVSTKDSGAWNDQMMSKLSFEGSSDSLFTNDPNVDHVHTALVKYMIAGTAIDIVFGIPTNPSTNGVPESGWLPPTAGHYKGKAKITTVDFNAPNGDKATMSVSFTGCGALQVVDPDPVIPDVQSMSSPPQGDPIAPAKSPASK